MWAARTWKGRGQLLRRFLKHRAANNSITRMPIGYQMAHFCSTNQQLKATTRLSYATSLRSMARRMGITSTPILDMLISGQSAAAATTRIKQAPAATPQQVERLMERAHTDDPSGRLAMTIWIAWKTASRWDDVWHLRRHNFIHFDQTRNEVVIEWGSLKTNRRHRFRSTSWTVLCEIQRPLTLRYLQRVVQRLPADTRLSPKTTSQFTRWAQRDDSTQKLSGHSVKRGAIDLLAQHACDGKIEPRLLPLIAKHKDALQEFPESTLRYITNRVALARMLGSQKATQLL